MKKLVATATGIVLAAALTACGNDSSDGADGDTIKIGVIVPLTGPTSTLGPISDGITSYFDSVNAAGGINGVKVEVIVKDDAYDPAKTPGIARSLVEQDGVDMMCAPTGTGPTGAISQYLTQQEVPTVALTGASELASSDSTLFQALPANDGLGAYSARFVVEDLGITDIAIAYSPDGIGEPFLEGAKAQLEELGIEPTVVEFNPKSPDQSTVASKLKASKAEVVLINHVTPIVASISKATDQQGYSPTFVSTYAMNDAKIAELSAGTLDGAYVATPYLIGTEPEAASYREALEEFAPDADILDPIIMEGWATADACHAVLEQAVEDAGGKPSRAQILDVMSDITIDTDYVSDLTWSEDDHTGQKSARVIQFDGSGWATVKEPTAFPDAG